MPLPIAHPEDASRRRRRSGIADKLARVEDTSRTRRAGHHSSPAAPTANRRQPGIRARGATLPGRSSPAGSPDLGAEVERWDEPPRYPVVAAKLPGSAAGAPWPSTVTSTSFRSATRAPGRHDPWGGDVDAGKLWGRGAADMKGGVACALVAMRAIRRVGHRAGGRSLDPRRDRRGSRRPAARANLLRRLPAGRRRARGRADRSRHHAGRRRSGPLPDRGRRPGESRRQPLHERPRRRTWRPRRCQRHREDAAHRHRLAGPGTTVGQPAPPSDAAGRVQHPPARRSSPAARAAAPTASST